jgi:hypothetical protein
MIPARSNSSGAAGAAVVEEGVNGVLSSCGQVGSLALLATDRARQ